MVFLKRFSARDLIFYLLAILVMVFTFNAVQQMNEPDDPLIMRSACSLSRRR